MVLRPLTTRAALLLSTASAALLVSGCQTQAQETQPAPETKPTQKSKTPPPGSIQPVLPTTPKSDKERAAEPPKSYKPVTISLGERAPDEVAELFNTAMKKVAVPPPPADFSVPAHPRVEFDTCKGKMVLELDATKAPLTVKSFVYLASKGFYKNTTFNKRSDITGDKKGYIIQGGDPLSSNPRTSRFAGMGGPGYAVPLEISDLKHDQFVIGAVRNNHPDSAGSQFYITQGAPHFFDGQHTVFGKIVDGKDVAAKLDLGDTLIAVKVLDASTPEDAPKTP